MSEFDLDDETMNDPIVESEEKAPEKKRTSKGKSSSKTVAAKDVVLKKGAGKVKERDDRIEVAGLQFPDLTAVAGGTFKKEMLAGIPIQVSVELGQTQMNLKEVLELQEGGVIELNRLAGEPLDLVVNGQLIARGEVVAIDEHYGFRVTEIVAKRANA